VHDAPVLIASMTATASTAPAAPSRCPIMPLVELMRSCGPGMAARMALRHHAGQSRQFVCECAAGTNSGTACRCMQRMPQRWGHSLSRDSQAVEDRARLLLDHFAERVTGQLGDPLRRGKSLSTCTRPCPQPGWTCRVH